ncbi:MAG: DNA-binding response regulator [Chthonomonadales bacterium]|nr:DNA-binding response regulator [Chthonomonadales bacterium]
MAPLSPSEQPIVLIVDDDALLTNMLRQSLTPKGFQVLEANTGASALALLGSQTAHIVVLDMTLPDMTGLQVAQTLAQTHPSLPVVIATGHDLDPAGLPVNVVEVIRKPFSLRSLAARLHELLKPA